MTEPGIDAYAEAVRLLGAVAVGGGMALAVRDDRGRAPARWLVLGSLLLVTGSVLLLVATLSPIAERLDEPLLPLILTYVEETTHGRMLFAPLLPTAYGLLLLDSLRAANDAPIRQGLRWTLLLAFVGMAWLMAGTGHGGMAQDCPVLMMAPVLHVAAGLGWVALIVSLSPRVLRGEPLSVLLRQWGDVALLMLVALVVSGVILAWDRGIRLPPSWDEPYFQLLAVKSALLVLALGAAAVNRIGVLRSEPVAEGRLREVLEVETALLLLALAVAAWLSRTPPPA